ncbi:DUF3237 domain-containing protein [Sphaerisporangium aureirubrum]|uniref:DUF3237 domain-containing protein n=1 Tax=Sphaerisporangium aureirubrum TaxID=1544736 RepID=A0ABW1NKW0_9ACTN
MINELPSPALAQVFRLHAVLGAPLDFGELGYGRRLIVPLTGGRFTGPELNGNLMPDGSAEWQSTLPDGTVLGYLRYTLRTDGGDLLQVRSRAVRYGGSADDFLVRATTRLQAAAPHLGWVNRGVFVSVGAHRGVGMMTYETYLVS